MSADGQQAGDEAVRLEEGADPGAGATEGRRPLDHTPLLKLQASGNLSATNIMARIQRALEMSDVQLPLIEIHWYCTGWLVVTDLGWSDFDWDVPPSCQVAQPILPKAYLPKLNRADNGMTKIIVNPTQIHDHQTPCNLFSDFTGTFVCCCSLWPTW